VGASRYHIQVDDNGDFSSPALSITSTSSNYTVGTPLTNGSYYWRVRTRDTMNTWGSWSTPWTLVIEDKPSPLGIYSIQFWPDVPVVDRHATFDFGSRIDFESTVITKAYLLGFFTYQGEEVPGESTCMGRAMPGRGGEVFWSTGTATELAPGVNSFERNYVYDQSAPGDATHLVMWLMFLDADEQMLTCWQKVIELSTVSP
jgi:hypothetical protein